MIAHSPSYPIVAVLTRVTGSPRPGSTCYLLTDAGVYQTIEKERIPMHDYPALFAAASSSALGPEHDDGVEYVAIIPADPIDPALLTPGTAVYAQRTGVPGWHYIGSIAAAEPPEDEDVPELEAAHRASCGVARCSRCDRSRRDPDGERVGAPPIAGELAADQDRCALRRQLAELGVRADDALSALHERRLAALEPAVQAAHLELCGVSLQSFDARPDPGADLRGRPPEEIAAAEILGQVTLTGDQVLASLRPTRWSMIGSRSGGPGWSLQDAARHREEMVRALAEILATGRLGELRPGAIEDAAEAACREWCGPGVVWSDVYGPTQESWRRVARIVAATLGRGSSTSESVSPRPGDVWEDTGDGEQVRLLHQTPDQRGADWWEVEIVRAAQGLAVAGFRTEREIVRPRWRRVSSHG